jgi:hypothetical protein
MMTCMILSYDSLCDRLWRPSSTIFKYGQHSVVVLGQTLGRPEMGGLA